MQRKRQLSELSPAVRLNLDLRLTDLDFSKRASNAFAFARMEFVGDLIQATEVELLAFPNCGRKTIAEIAEKLAGLELQLGLAVSDWSRQAAKAKASIRPARGERPKGSFASRRVVCLEEELAAILDLVASGRDHAIVSKYWGWTGSGRRTLESVGDEYGVTRERIRQIAWRAENKLRKYSIEAPWLSKAMQVVGETCPASPSSLSAVLLTRGITKSSFEVDALRFACELLGRDYRFSDVPVGAASIVVRSRCEEKIADFLRLSRRLTSAQGCANFDAMCDEVGILESDRAGLRREIGAAGCVWLDDDRRWLYANDTARNRLSNLVGKVLSVCQSLPLAELRRAIARSRRLAIVPPTNVLARFLEDANLAIVVGDRVSAVANFERAIAAGSIEETLVEVLKEHGPVLGWEQFQDLCIARGVNPISFSINASASPVVARLARGIYSLVGAEISPGLVEEVAAQAASTRKRVDWGWSGRGTLWCSFDVSATVLSAGSVMIPSFVDSIAEGDWRPSIAGREVDDVVRCGNGFLWGLRCLLLNSGAEAGDVCIIEFDITARKAVLTIGDEDLADAWERGEERLIVQSDVDGDRDG